MARWELYNITKDGTEMNDLASQFPEKVKSLSQLWHQQATQKGQLKGRTTAPVNNLTPPKLKKNGTPTHIPIRKAKASGAGR